VPQENIARAIHRGNRGEETLETLTLEAYGPEGIALLIEGVTDNKNRTIMEIKTLLKARGAKFAEPGSVRWAFEMERGSWRAKFPQTISPGNREALKELVGALESHDDVQSVATNAAP
jgi:transcriptional/translational regulatory protein YebC/TACO1